MEGFEKYKEKLRSRIHQLIVKLDEGEANKEFISFEVLSSIFGILDDGYHHGDLKDAYPVVAWREETVEVPKALLREICAGWLRYRETDSGVSLGNAFKLEGGQGKSPVANTNSTLDLDVRRSNQVLVEVVATELEGGKPKSDAIYQIVAEREASQTGKRVSYKTIKKAHLKFGPEKGKRPV